MLLVLIFIILSRMDWWMKFMSNNFFCWCNQTTCQFVNCKQCTNSLADFEPSFCICFGCLNLIESKTRFRSLRKRLIFNCRYRDSTLLNSLFYWLRGHIYITPHTLLVADHFKHKCRLVDMNSRVFVDGYYQYIINVSNKFCICYHIIFICKPTTPKYISFKK